MALTPSTLRFYTTADNITDLDVSAYWASGAGVRQPLTAGDVIIATCGDGGVNLYVTVATATASTVAIFA